MSDVTTVMPQGALEHRRSMDSSASPGTGVDTSAGVLLRVEPVTGLLMLRARDQAANLSKALQTQCGVTLPGRLQSLSSEHYSARWMSPDNWLLSCPFDEVSEVEKSLRSAVGGHVAVVDVSGGYTLITLSGIDALNVLKKCTAYDVHPRNFPVGKVVNTTFAKAQTTLRAMHIEDGQGAYEVIVRRSFSDYLWLWLQQASLEYRVGNDLSG